MEARSQQAGASRASRTKKMERKSAHRDLTNVQMYGAHAHHMHKMAPGSFLKGATCRE